MTGLAATPDPPYTAVIFTSVRIEDDAEGHAQMAAQMDALAAEQPGYLSVESAREEVGITVSSWRSAQHARAWMAIAEHQLAQRLGRVRWYRSYRVRIATVDRDCAFPTRRSTAGRPVAIALVANLGITRRPPLTPGGRQPRRERHQRQCRRQHRCRTNTAARPRSSSSPIGGTGARWPLRRRSNPIARISASLFDRGAPDVAQGVIQAAKAVVGRHGRPRVPPGGRANLGPYSGLRRAARRRPSRASPTLA